MNICTIQMRLSMLLVMFDKKPLNKNKGMFVSTIVVSFIKVSQGNTPLRGKVIEKKILYENE